MMLPNGSSGRSTTAHSSGSSTASSSTKNSRTSSCSVPAERACTGWMHERCCARCALQPAHQEQGRARHAIDASSNVTRRAVIFLLGAAACLSTACRDTVHRPADTAADTRELVVLVHGMGRTSLSMVPLQRDLRAAGYRVMSWGYSSYCCTIAELGARLRRDVDASRGAAPRIHFVGHSLGNILVRWMLTGETQPTGVGRGVMLA